MDRISDNEIGAMWVQHYPQRNNKASWLVLSALVNIIKGHSVIKAHAEADTSSKTLHASLKDCNVPIKEFWQIEQQKIE